MLQATNFFLVWTLRTLYTNANLSRYAKNANNPVVCNVYNYKNSYAHCPQNKNMSFFITFYKAPMQNINNNNNLQTNSSPAIELE